MNSSKPSNDSVCPLCHKIPEDFGIKNHEAYVWNGMTECFICEFCNTELAIEFYEEDSRYFRMVSRHLGLSVWECKKLYLEDIIVSTGRRLIEEHEVNRILELTRRMRDCRKHHAAIERFLAVESRSSDELEVRRARRELLRELEEPAFGVEVAMPGIISVLVD